MVKTEMNSGERFKDLIELYASRPASVEEPGAAREVAPLEPVERLAEPALPPAALADPQIVHAVPGAPGGAVALLKSSTLAKLNAHVAAVARHLDAVTVDANGKAHGNEAVAKALRGTRQALRAMNPITMTVADFAAVESVSEAMDKLGDHVGQLRHADNTVHALPPGTVVLDVAPADTVMHVAEWLLNEARKPDGKPYAYSRNGHDPILALPTDTRADQPLQRYLDWHQGRVGDFGKESPYEVKRMADDLSSAGRWLNNHTVPPPRSNEEVVVWVSKTVESSEHRWPSYVEASVSLLRHPQEIENFVKDYVERSYFLQHWTHSAPLTNAEASRLAIVKLRAVDRFDIPASTRFFWNKAIAQFTPRRG